MFRPSDLRYAVARPTQRDTGAACARRWGFALALACIAACSAPPPPSPAPAAASEPPRAQTPALPKVAFLGDSIAAGLHLPAAQAFPALVHARLAQSGAPFELMNAGVSGDTTAGGVRRVDWLLKQAPRVVVIELGANDGMRGLPVEAVEANLRAIIAKVRAAGSRVLLLGIRIPPNYGPEYVAAFEGVYPRIATELQVPFVPYFMEGVAGVPSMNLEDGIHPTPEGHSKLAEKISEPLRALLTG
jgi:acyl-CoA thioesterase-1